MLDILPDKRAAGIAWLREAETNDEGSQFSKENVREVQSYPAQGGSARDLPEPETQAAPGIGAFDMPKILGVDIPANKKVPYSLCYLYGIGRTRAMAAVATANVDASKKVGDLTAEELARITSVIQEGYVLEGDLRREVAQNIRRLVSISAYRGVRHRKGLPVRGQRTHTNARTRKGVKKTVGVVRGKEARSAVKKES